jgi:predicted phage replisome organizer
MAEIKWVKLTTDMFDNRKIKHLRRLPEGNNIVLIWVMLLTMAGRCNSGGLIFLTENIPYTPKMLADELDFEESTVILAMKSLEQLNMIVTDGGFFSIAGWDEYQNIEGMDKIREQNRIRQANFKAKRKQLQGNVTGNVTLTLGNATEEDIEEEKDIDKEKEVKKRRKKTKDFSPPTLEDIEAYCKSRNNNVDAKRFFDFFDAADWVDSKGNKVRNWKQKVITWESYNKEVKQDGQATGDPGKVRVGHYL